MANSLGDEICLYLQGQGIGLNFNGVGTINLFSSLLPDQPDLGVAVIERGGIPPLLTMTGVTGQGYTTAPESKIDQPTVMIRVRAGMSDYVNGQLMTQNVYSKLQGITEQTLNVSGMFFHLITALQYPMYLGRDERQRHLWSQNYRMMIENDQR